MTTMLERMAKALFSQRMSNRIDPANFVWDQLPNEYRDGLMTDAKAALTTLLEPTPGMILEGAKAAADQAYCKGQVWEHEGFLSEEAKESLPREAKYSFIAMINAALNEEDRK